MKMILGDFKRGKEGKGNEVRMQAGEGKSVRGAREDSERKRG